ncbi:MAG TPA: hypothetical protein VK449_03455, partial [Anaerolineales bacterium]|nr:hypothetical protein [Anaerolineales bacterium]
LLGAVPLLVWATLHGPGRLLSELFGSAIAGASPAQLPRALASHLLNLLLFGPTVALGVRPPWSAAPLNLWVAPIILLLWSAAIILGLRRDAWPATGQVGRWLLVGPMVALLAGFVLTPFGADPSGRYFLPLMAPLVVIGAAGVQAAVRRSGRRWPLVLAGVVLAFNLWANLFVASRAPGFTTQFDVTTIFDHDHDAALADFLLEQGATTGYSTYWVAYPLAFLSQERLVYLPALPYHSDFRYTARDDRYPPYRAVVAVAANPAYITARQPWLDDYLRSKFQSRGVTFQEATIGDYHVFYRLSRAMRPADLGLGPEAAP